MIIICKNYLIETISRLHSENHNNPPNKGTLKESKMSNFENNLYLGSYKDSYGESYSDPIPIDKIIVMATKKSAQSDSLIRQNTRKHTEKLVLKNVCSCISSSECIVEAVIDECLRRANLNKQNIT